MRTAGIGESWDSFGSGHYLSAQLETAKSTSEVSDLGYGLIRCGREFVEEAVRTYALHAGV